MFGWNLGGVEVQDLPQTLMDAAPQQLEKSSLILLQEYQRGVQGWAVEKQGQWTLVTHRHASVWRGTGLMYNTDIWCLTRRVATKKGTWFRLRAAADSADVIWVGTAHFTPGCTVACFEEEAEEHFQGLPASANRVVFQGDINTPMGWVRHLAEVTPVAKEGKGGILLKILNERGLLLNPPMDSQFGTPTSRPRQQGRGGQHIDVFASRGLHASGTTVHEDSYMIGGTDHELMQGGFRATWCRRPPRRCTRRRVVCKQIGTIDFIDHVTIAEMAMTHTKPAPSLAYKDPESVKALFRRAKQRGTAVVWKEALKARKAARKEWEVQRLQRAAGGDWTAIREVKGARHEGWDVDFALHQQGDSHENIHKHFAGVYASSRVDPVVEPWKGDVEGFTEEELWAGVKQLKARKSVGKDLTSRELLEGICHAPGGAQHVVEFFNRVLATQNIPKNWNEPLLVMLPKVCRPRSARELRPIALGSSVGKLFSRMLLNRCLHKLRLEFPPQCAGVHRQTNDFTFSLIPLFELEREWQRGMAAVKVDISRAFDDVDRDVLLAKLTEKLGPGPELQCWKGLLANNSATVSTPFGESSIEVGKGIKQGAIESPAFFGMIMEMAVHEAGFEHKWHEHTRLFPDLQCPDAALFMDDGVLWTLGTKGLQQRVSDLAKVLLRYGLRVNLAKCQLYCAPRCPGPPSLNVGDQVLEADDHLSVMGLRLWVGQSVCSLVSPLASRCRAKFWEIRHLLRTPGQLYSRVRVMQRIVGASALWCIASVPPDKAAMSMMNSVQLRLLVWLMRLGRRSGETWMEFRQRAFRSACAVLNNAKCERWSTLWLRRYWQFAGHRARAINLPAPCVSAYFEGFRTLSWWRVEKLRPGGIRHNGQHYARLTLLEQNLDGAAGGDWRAIAGDRVKWRECEQRWIDRMDLAWSSGRQLSLTNTL
eukprot:s5535_g3.t1